MRCLCRRRSSGLTVEYSTVGHEFHPARGKESLQSVKTHQARNRGGWPARRARGRQDQPGVQLTRTCGITAAWYDWCSTSRDDDDSTFYVVLAHARPDRSPDCPEGRTNPVRRLRSLSAEADRREAKGGRAAGARELARGVLPDARTRATEDSLTRQRINP